MKKQRVLEQGKVEWFTDENSRLNYQLIFSEQQEEEVITEHSQDLDEVLTHRDNRWKNKLNQARKEAYQKGLEEGYDQGLNEARDEFERKLEGFQAHFEQAREEWKRQQEQLTPGVLDLAFDIAEKILQIPVENPAVRERLEQQLLPLFRNLDQHTKAVIYTSVADFSFVEELYKEYAHEISLRIVAKEGLNPGEFNLETPGARVISDFREMLNEFKETLSLPTWKA